jgi:hypothetical protein
MLKYKINIYNKRFIIKKLFQSFAGKHPYLNFEQLIDYFSIFGGTTELEIDYFATLFEFIENKLVNNFDVISSQIKPSYILESPYREVLMAIAKGDGKIYSSIKKARLNEHLGENIIDDLTKLGIIRLEASKELETNSHKKYRIQSKLRFKKPFFRFWFGFVEPYRESLETKDASKFIENFKAHYERLRSLIFEHLSEEFLIDYYNHNGINIVFSGSYWDKDNEFDIVALTESREVILAECKYKDRKICKNELTKLKAKAMQSNLPAKHWVLFSKQGFSMELKNSKNKDLLLFDLQDLSKWK